MPTAAWAIVAGSLTAGAAHAQTGADSLAVLEAARDAQAAFERERVRLLPWTWGSTPSWRDEVVGRIVLLDDEEDDRPPPEPDRVATHRAALIETLDSLAGELPGDAWIAGQRVHYRVEGGDSSAALEVARGCRSTAWWCAALEGYALHAASRFTSAEAAFSRALQAMPADRRARWSDIEELLDAEGRKVYRASSGADREALVARFWLLADPLYSIPGNERRSEHYARHVVDRILESARSPFELRWGRDLREVVVRYGWPVAWERTRPRSSLGKSRGGVVGHDPPGERRFAPPGAVLAAPYASTAEAWSLEDRHAPTAYAPAYAERFADLEHQLAVFRRAGRAVVVAGWSIPEEAGARARAALIVTDDATRNVSRAPRPASSGALSVRVPWSPAIFSLEAVAPEAGFAARSRYGVPLPVGVVSDLLLVDGRATPDAGLEDVARRARANATLTTGEAVTLYWELYPPPGVARAAMSLALRDERGGFWRGLGSVVGLSDDRTGSVALEWQEPLPGRAVVPRAVRLELPELPAGDYALELTVELDDGPATTRRRAIEITPGAELSAR